MPQPVLPATLSLPALQDHTRNMVQHFGWQSLSNDQVFLLFVEEIGELAKAIRKANGVAEEKAKADPDHQNPRDNLAEEMADVLSYLADLANRYGVDLDTAYRKKMIENLNREWK